jgi:prevent-host-death family protein
MRAKDRRMSRQPFHRYRSNGHYNDHVTIKVTATEAKAKILSLLDRASAGEVVEITKHGRTVARLVAASGPRSLEGAMTGVAMSAAGDPDLFTTGAPWNTT